MQIPVYPDISYTSTGKTNTYSFPFDYLRKAYVKVKLDGVDVAQANYSVNGKNVVFKTNPQAGVKIYIYRDTPTTRLVTWADASVLKASNMTIQQVQELHLLEEQTNYNETLLAQCETIKSQTETIKNQAQQAATTATTAATTSAQQAATNAVNNVSKELRDEFDAIYRDTADISAKCLTYYMNTAEYYANFDLKSEEYLTTFNNIKDDINLKVAQILRMKNTVETKYATVLSVSDQVGAIKDDIDTTYANCQNTSNRISTMYSTITEKAFEVATAKDQIDTAEANCQQYANDISSHAAQIDTNTENIATLTTANVSLENRVQNLEQQDIRNKANIKAVENGVSTVESNLERTQDTLEDVNWIATENRIEIGNIKNTISNINSIITRIDNTLTDTTEQARLNRVSIDRHDVAIDNFSTVYQKKLVAGDGIKIDGNTISTTSSSTFGGIYVGTTTPDGYSIYIEPEEVIPVGWVDCTLSNVWSGKSGWGSSATTGTVRYSIDGSTVTIEVTNIIPTTQWDSTYATDGKNVVNETLPIPNATMQGTPLLHSDGSSGNATISVNSNGELIVTRSGQFVVLGGDYSCTFSYRKV